MQSPTPPLRLISSLPSPSGLIRAWQSQPHPSKPLLATASSDKSVNIWSLRDFRLLSTINGGHKRSVRTVGWKDYGKPDAQKEPDGADGAAETGEEQVGGKLTLATGSFDANVGIWEYNSTYNQPPSSASAIENETDLTHDKDEEEWHFSTLLTGPDSEIKSLAFSPAHYGLNLLATSSRDKSVWVWEEIEPEEWETIAVLSEHAGDVKCVAWNPARELLASSSYDDTVRLWKDVEEEGDWVCVGVLEGSGGTVWGVVWEKKHQGQGMWEPRLASCSDDLRIRVWRRVLSESERARRDRDRQGGDGGAQRLPSIIRPPSAFETWEQESILPEVHVRSIYAMDWSARTGLMVSCGGDGVIAVYREVPAGNRGAEIDSEENGDVIMNSVATPSEESKTSWEVVAMMEAAHDEYEINHVAWAHRWDKGRRTEGEEVIVSTGDDGVVRVWEIPDGIR